MTKLDNKELEQAIVALQERVDALSDWSVLISQHVHDRDEKDKEQLLALIDEIGEVVCQSETNAENIDTLFSNDAIIEGKIGKIDNLSHSLAPIFNHKFKYKGSGESLAQFKARTKYH